MVDARDKLKLHHLNAVKKDNANVHPAVIGEFDRISIVIDRLYDQQDRVVNYIRPKGVTAASTITTAPAAVIASTHHPIVAKS